MLICCSHYCNRVLLCVVMPLLALMHARMSLMYARVSLALRLSLSRFDWPGVMISLFFHDPNDKTLYQKMAEDITKEEIKILKLLGIDDNDHDNNVLQIDFYILISMRIGTVSPPLIKLIMARFQMLDRHQAKKISYDDLIVDRAIKRVGGGWEGACAYHIVSAKKEKEKEEKRRRGREEGWV